MNHLETLLEEYRAELAELEKAYHTFTDVVGNRCDTKEIVSALQTQIIIVSDKVSDLESAIEATQTHEPEFDKYSKENY